MNTFTPLSRKSRAVHPPVFVPPALEFTTRRRLRKYKLFEALDTHRTSLNLVPNVLQSPRTLLALLQASIMRAAGAGGSYYKALDYLRRQLGSILDAIGYRPKETPFRAVQSNPGFSLRGYENAVEGSPVVLLIPAPIKRAYIWDLLPQVSVVQRCLEAGLQVYLIAWEEPNSPEHGLAVYADQFLLTCLDKIHAETGKRCVFLIGHSLGGTLAAIFSALHQERVKGLVLLAAPLHFGSDISAFGPVTAAISDVHALTGTLGNIPGTFLNAMSLLASPQTFLWSRELDLVWSTSDLFALRTHLLVERWTLDELTIAKRLFEEVVEWLYRENRFMRGTLRVGGQPAAPDLIEAPLLIGVDARCDIAPPEAILPFQHAVRSPDKMLLWYPGDRGVSLQHVGMLVGQNAHQRLWPHIIDWIYAHE